jgi:hypothetical protein
MRNVFFAAVVAGVLGLGCSDDASSPSATGDPPGPSWAPLVAADWELESGQEAYVCTRTTMAEDTWVRALRPAGLETLHHALIMLEDTGEDGTFPCSVSTVGPNLLYASGVGTGEYTLPEGVAVRLAKGQKVLLQLHLFNTATERTTGNTGVEAVLGEPIDADHEAEMVLAGRPQLEIPPGEVKQSGTCTMTADVTLFGLWPHMHQLGTHLVSVATPQGAAPIPLWDAPFDFGEQPIVDLLAPVALKKGDQVSVECTYQNTTGEIVNWGEGSNDEMCFIGLYRYPKIANLPICAN